jgi:integrase
MASVEDRWFRQAREPNTGDLIAGDNGKPVMEKTDRHGVGKRWLVRWRDPDKAEHKLSFAKKVDADAHKSVIEADMLRGNYIDPAGGRETFGSYATKWLGQQTTDPLTQQEIRGRMRRYVEGTNMWRAQLRAARPSTVQAWVKGLPANLTESTKSVAFSHVSAVWNAAVADELIGKNPCLSPVVRRPRPESKLIVPWDRVWVASVREALPARYRPLADEAAWLGLRQGEAFGLSPDDVDWPAGKWATVSRQVKLVGNRLVFAAPKGGRTRRVPLSPVVRDALAAHLAEFPARSVTLPWRDPGGEPVTVRLIVTTREAGPCNRNNFNPTTWKPALQQVGIEPTRVNGMHALRHFFASVLLDGGESIKAVSEWLGHSNPAFTLRVYTHLMPSSEDRSRTLIDAAFLSLRAPTVPLEVVTSR